MDNTARGVLAEFIVAKAIEADAPTRTAWDAYELLTPAGIKVEVKSASYLQAWFQKKRSTISFSIRTALKWPPESNGLVGPSRRHSDVYVFCLITQMDKQLLNPLDLAQWEFFIAKTADIDSRYGERKSITLRQVKTLSPSYASEGLAFGIETIMSPASQ